MSKELLELTIGALAKAAGVNVETVRYYQRKDLISEPHKPLQGFRKYPLNTVENIKFIKRAQKLGFSLRDIAELLELGTGSCDDIRVCAESQRDKIEKQIRDLERLHHTLNQLIQKSHSGQSNQHCPIVESLLKQDN